MSDNIVQLNTIKDYEETNQKRMISSTEVSEGVTPLYNKSQWRPYNPDKLYRKRGNYDIYDEMREDDAIKAVLMTKKYLMLNPGWDIKLKDEKDQTQIDAKEFIMKALNTEIEIDFNASLLEMLTNMDYGVSFSEVVWKFDKKNYWLKYIKTRAPHGFRIHTDFKGNIDFIDQSTQTKGYIKVPLDKFIILPFQKEFDNWYGKPDLLSAYKAWWSKEFIIKSWNIFLDRFGMPLAIGKFDSATTNEADQKKLQNLLANLQTKTAATIPKDLEIEFLEATRRGDGGYEKAINSYNMMIGRSMLMPDLMGLSGSETSGGSFALGEVQTDMFLDTLEWTRRELQRKIQRKIINPLVQYNFALDSNDYPEFIFNPISNKDKMDAVNKFTELMGKGIVPTPEQENWMFRNLGAPIKEDEDFEADAIKKEEDAQRQKDIMDNMDNEPIADPKEPIKKGDAEPVKKGAPQEDDDEKKMTTDIAVDKITDNGLRSPIMAEKKIDFVKVERTFVDNTAKTSDAMSATYDAILEDLIHQMKKGKWIENKRLDKVANYNIKFSKQLEVQLRTGTRKMFSSGITDAKVEVKVKEFTALNEDEMFDLIVKATPVFTVTTMNSALRDKIQLTISNGIKEGLAQGTVVKQIKSIFTKYDTAVDGATINTNVRTTFTSAYNSAKMSYFQPLADTGDIKAYQFSAILDGRTSDVCNSLNGKIFLADDVSDVTPPLHANCRSLLVPITKDEVADKDIFGATESQNSTFFPKDKFRPSDKNEALTGFETTTGGFWKPIPKG